MAGPIVYRADLLINRVGTEAALYKANVVNKFYEAYEPAYNKYIEVVDEQDKADKAKDEAKVEMAILALSLLGGVGLGTVIGATCAKAYAGGTITNTMKRYLVTTVSDRKALKKKIHKVNDFATDVRTEFIAGELYDLIQSKGSARVKESMKVSSSDLGDAKKMIESPGMIKNRMQTYLYRIEASARILIEEIFTDQLGSDKKKLCEVFQKTSPLLNIKKSLPSSEVLSRRIELLMWMRYLTTLDWTKTEKWVGESGSLTNSLRKEWVEAPIRTSVRDQKNYPKLKGRVNNPHSRWGATYRQEVFYKDAGDKIRERINELYMKEFGEKFFVDSVTYLYIDFYRQPINKSLLWRAEQNIEMIQRKMPSGSAG
ncbi:MULTISPECIES: hypothetical protein [unclassified Roseibium]|uniref:hypothetical protein n=1 Tax=unclassified Roseibium TaxID=2629323 RepID=UPI00092BEB44|nr:MULTISPECIES: hypothetical protein [unclassified Roseibium]OJJ09397.1 hypothetical protein BKI51_23465 [Alphaproteobacteria bacterium AO1-B]